jgi:hypothetical protein
VSSYLFFTLLLPQARKIWEPTISYLLQSSAAVCDLIDEIWSFESIQHGDSALLNAANLPGICLSFFSFFLNMLWRLIHSWIRILPDDWTDNGRDVLNFMLHYLPSHPSSSTTELPVHLPLVSATETEARKTRGYPDRKLVPVGHCLGGCASYVNYSNPVHKANQFIPHDRAQVALTYPALFDSLILVDPAILMQPHDARREEHLHVPAREALRRREMWSSTYVIVSHSSTMALQMT